MDENIIPGKSSAHDSNLNLGRINKLTHLRPPQHACLVSPRAARPQSSMPHAAV